jgi:hypothetical protein
MMANDDFSAREQLTAEILIVSDEVTSPSK